MQHNELDGGTSASLQVAPVPKPVTLEEARAILGAENVLGPEVLEKLSTVFSERLGKKIVFQPDASAALPSRDVLDALRIRGGTLAIHPSQIVIDGEVSPVTAVRIIRLLGPGNVNSPVQLDTNDLREMNQPYAKGEVPGEYEGGWKVEGPATGQDRSMYSQVVENVSGTNLLQTSNRIDVSAPNTAMPSRLPTVTEALMMAVRDQTVGRKNGVSLPIWTSTPGDRPNTVKQVGKTGMGLSIINVDSNRATIGANIFPVRSLVKPK